MEPLSCKHIIYSTFCEGGNLGLQNIVKFGQDLIMSAVSKLPGAAIFHVHKANLSKETHRAESKITKVVPGKVSTSGVQVLKSDTARSSQPVQIQGWVGAAE